MNAIRASYVCALCSQTFTRKLSGKRHNITLHSGTAPIVRFMDYIIGRIEGRYRPDDPLFYRRRNKIMNLSRAGTVSKVSASRVTVIPDKTKESSQNDVGLGYKQDPLDLHLDGDEIRPKMDSTRETNQSRLQRSQGQEVYQKKTSPSSSYGTIASEISESMAKVQKFANLVKKHYPKDDAKELLFCACMLGPEELERSGWLAFLHNLDKKA